MDYNNPVMKHAFKQIQKYADSVDSIIETLDENFSYAILTFNFKLLEEMKEKINDVISMIDKYLSGQDQKYEEFVERLKMFGVNDNSECLALLWDIKRPIIYRVQKLNEFLEAIDGILT